MDLTQEEYAKDSRIACKYGNKCYQKNPAHHTKYKHPPKKRLGDNNAENINKRPRTDRTNGNSSDSNDDCRDESVQNVETISEVSSETNDETSASMETSERHRAETSADHSQNILKSFDNKEFIKSKFLVEMPNDFYKFWDFCKELKSDNPLLALKEVDLTLVGPFDVLAGKFDRAAEQSDEEYLLHWRFYYDPPEFQTVLIGNSSGYHIGYFRDEPMEYPVFLAQNCADKDGSFDVMGDNIFAAVYIHLNDLLKTASPFKKMSIQLFLNLIKKDAEKNNFHLSKQTPSISNRNKRIVARSFNTLGMVVPRDKGSELGYRPLAMSNRELKVLFEKISKANGKEEKDRLMSEFQSVLTNASIAMDECDFGTGLELGLDLLFYGIHHLNSLTKKYLSNAYNLLNRSQFAKIAQAHMDNRKKRHNLSII